MHADAKNTVLWTAYRFYSQKVEKTIWKSCILRQKFRRFRIFLFLPKQLRWQNWGEYHISNPLDFLATAKLKKTPSKWEKKENNNSNNSFYPEKNAKHSFHISTLLCIFQRLPKGINASILFLMVCNTYVIYTNVWKKKYSSIYVTSFYMYRLLLKKFIVLNYQSNQIKVQRKRIIK